MTFIIVLIVLSYLCITFGVYSGFILHTPGKRTNNTTPKIVIFTLLWPYWYLRDFGIDIASKALER